MTDLFKMQKKPHGDAPPSDFGLPTFLVIGAHRSGTTSLYYGLAEHPQVFMSPVKETNFFALANGVSDLPLTPTARERMLERSVSSADEYAALFGGSAGAIAVGEVSPSYLYSRQAATNIKDSLPEAKLVVVLRDPVDRAYSAFTRRNTGDQGPEAFLETVDREAALRARGEPADRLTLVDGSLYGRHLSEYLKLFERDQVRIELYEELWSGEVGSHESLHAFLGLEPSSVGRIARYNQSGNPRSEQLDRFVRGAPRLKSFVKKNLPNKWVRRAGQARQAIERWNLDKPAGIPIEVRSALIDRYFRDDIGALEGLTGLDLSLWLEPRSQGPAPSRT
jgi:hypothetical protein